MSFRPRLYPRTWVLSCCCIFIAIFLVASFNGKLVLPTQIPQGTYSSAQLQSKVPLHELLEDVANTTLGVSASSLKHNKSLR
jgi:hypothetical protein